MLICSDKNDFAVEKAILNDALDFEGGVVVVDEPDFCAVRLKGVTKCLTERAELYYDYAKKYDLSGHVCLLGVQKSAGEMFVGGAEPCKSYAYMYPMPPACERFGQIHRLAPSLAPTVLAAYHNPGSYDEQKMAGLMRERGVFGLIDGGKLCGFIGMHGDGNMGMLEVYPSYRRRGFGLALQAFLITYIMTGGRVPICDVFADNAPSIALQAKLGMTEAKGYTFWGEAKEVR